VTIDVIVLALGSTIRPTSLAAVYALLAHERRRVLILAYVVGGLVFTIAFGLLVVYAFNGIHPHALSGRTKAIADIIGGAVAMAFGVAVVTGRVRRSRGDPRASGRMQMTLDQRVTVRAAVVAGPATHIPGVFYVVALNVIVAHRATVVGGTFAVTAYNAIWYALPITALVFCIVRPGAARAAVGSVEQWATEHSRAILLAVSFGVGCYLIVRGALSL
jgi:Sap-like sulfolipid-1-addressing protein